jgi:hypothetical protein
MSAVGYIVVEISPKGVSLASGPFSGPRQTTGCATASLLGPIGRLRDSLRTPIGCAAWRERTREMYG